MSGLAGVVTAAAEFGSSAILVSPQRGFYNLTLPDGSLLPSIAAQATIEEKHLDEMEITEHPVEQGAAITDHMYKLPARVSLQLGWSDSLSLSSGMLGSTVNSVAINGPSALVDSAGGPGPTTQSLITGSGVLGIRAIYDRLLEMQQFRTLFTLYTGKRVYRNMVCRSLSTVSDFRNAHTLPITMECQEIILVNTRTAPLPANQQANPSATASPVNKGTQSPSPVSSGVTG
jgi:hypothetical protein